MQSSRFLIGIDLGTTNSAVAYIDTREAVAAIHGFDIPQLIAEGETGSSATLPSFLYFVNEREAVAGIFAREQGALVPGRQVTSAKSWLCHDAVDRTARILPWGAEQPEQTCSPVEASTRYLIHLREAWNRTLAADDQEWRLERQEVVLTVPASFDEEARELTVRAAREAGLERLTLLEEPLAAFYAWIATHRPVLRSQLEDGDLILVCDVGGGTTDFSLIRVQIAGEEFRFERTAIGEHLLLGGDNVDLALARRVMERLGQPKLSLRQQNALRRQCCAAKERLLGDERLDRLPISVLGAGQSVVGGALHTELRRQEVEELIGNGFLPATEPDDLPIREKRTGLRELGLPYAAEPAITKHLAGFLTRSGEAAHLVRPDAILFNGGFFTPALARERLVEAVAGWHRRPGERWRPKLLSNEAPERAVAIGAAYYGQVRKSGGMRISGGSARAYYIGVQTEANVTEGLVQAVCVLPRGTEEGTTLNLEGKEFMALANQPVSFTLYSSTLRRDTHGEVVTLSEAEVHRHAPLITTLRYGKKWRQVELAVRLSTGFTEVGTLELWCESLKSDHRWRLQFQLRSADPEPEAADDPAARETSTVVSEEAFVRAEQLIRAVFGEPPSPAAEATATPETLVEQLEAAFHHRKEAWPMAAIRKLYDLLVQVADGRRRGPKFEARWLNLFGFCLRPGFGAPADDWRVTQARQVYLAGPAFPKDLQCQAEWLVLWRRVAGGMNANQQHELYQRVRTALGIEGRKLKGRLNTQIEREGWRLVASLEHLPAPTRVALGKELLGKAQAEPANQSFLWSLGRLGARIPLYGPLNCVVPAENAGHWIHALLQLPELTPAVASAVVQLGARTGDPQRDIEDDLRQSALARLSEIGKTEGLLESLRQYVPPGCQDAVRIFGESLPEGLRFVG
ncbi:MAG TPA: Hsp70 family protein [Blastocatellia bacterium]|nr:Hsp70 family protein [Blastocatellia bacterium]